MIILLNFVRAFNFRRRPIILYMGGDIDGSSVSLSWLRVIILFQCLLLAKTGVSIKVKILLNELHVNGNGFLCRVSTVIDTLVCPSPELLWMARLG